MPKPSVQFLRFLLASACAMAGTAASQPVKLRFASFEPATAPITSRVLSTWARQVSADSRGALEVEEARVPGRDLDAGVAEPGRPPADRVERAERRLVARELREEDAGALHGRGHGASGRRIGTAGTGRRVSSRRRLPPGGL